MPAIGFGVAIIFGSPMTDSAPIGFDFSLDFSSKYNSGYYGSLV